MPRAGPWGPLAPPCSPPAVTCQGQLPLPALPGAGCSPLLQFLPAICGQSSTRRDTKPVTSAPHLIIPSKTLSSYFDTIHFS